MKINTNITGIEETRAQLLRIGALPKQALAVTAEGVEVFVVQEASKHNKTGALVQSTYLRRAGDSFDIGHDGQRAPQALWVHWGTKPHVIAPLGGTYTSYTDISGNKVSKGIKKGGQQRQKLRWAGGGIFHFARIVHHPGNKADPWMTRAAALAPRLFDQHLQALLARGI